MPGNRSSFKFMLSNFQNVSNTFFYLICVVCTVYVFRRDNIQFWVECVAFIMAQFCQLLMHIYISFIVLMQSATCICIAAWHIAELRNGFEIKRKLSTCDQIFCSSLKGFPFLHM